MKNYIPILLMLSPYCVSAQLDFALKENNVSESVKEVIEDFPNHFNSIRGELIGQDVQAINYTSTINIDGADSSIIIQNGNDSDNIFSWNEIVFETEDFSKAKFKFHEYFNKIKHTIVTVDGRNINFNADYNEPAENKLFTTVLFAGKPETAKLKNVVIDLSLHYVVRGWQLSVSVYEHTDYGVENAAN